MRIAMATVVACFSFVAFSAPPPVQAAVRKPTNIPAQPLSRALQTLAKERDFQIAYVADEVESVHTLGASGDLTSEEALTQLLRGTGLTFRTLAQDGVTIVPAAGTLPAAPPVDASRPKEDAGERVERNDSGKRSAAGRQDRFRIAQAEQSSGSQSSQTPGTNTGSGAESGKLEEVVVTGTSIRGVAPTGSELISVSRDDIVASGATTSTELLRSVPQLALFNASGINNGQNQANFADQPAIHGIGVGNGGAGLTLLLLDGHRLPGAGINQTAPDASVIPTSAIERVEVLADGGSSVYGSDAVAGVINFITRRDFNGAETGAQTSFADGYRGTSFSQLLGRSWDGGSVLFNYQYSINDALNGTERDYSVSDQRSSGGPDGRSTTCTPGNIAAGGSSFGITGGAPVAGLTVRCESARGTDLYPRQHRHQGYLAAHQDLSDTVELYGNVLYSARKLADDVAGNSVTSGGLSVTVPSTSPFYLTLPGVPAGTPESVTYDPSADFGAFRNRIDTSTLSTVAGTHVRLGETWNGQFEINYGRERDDVNEFGINQAAAIAAAAAGTFNPYGIGAPTNQSVLATIGDFRTRYLGIQTLKDAQLKVDGPVFDIGGGSVRAAAGAEWRREVFDGLTSTGPVAGPLSTGPYRSVGSRESKSAFIEFHLPLVGSSNAMTGIQSFEISLAARYDDYDDVGNTTNPKIGVNWKPSADLLVRASAGKSFHAPSLADAPSAIDTRAIRFGCVPGAFVGCTTAGPSDYSVILAGGNVLKPEKARTYNFGFDWTPQSLDGLRASLTYFRVDYKDVITFPTFAPVTNPLGAYDAYRVLRPAGSSDAQWAATVTSLLTGFRHDGLLFGDPGQGLPLVVFDLRRQNFADELINGIDYAFSYRWETGASRLNVGIAGTQMMSFNQTIPGVSPNIQLIDTNYSIRQKVRGSFGWAFGDYRLQTFINHTGKYRNETVTPHQSVSSFTTVDLGGDWQLPHQGIFDNTTVSLQVQNLFDRDPPFLFSGSNGTGFDAAVANAFGRQAIVSVRKAW